MKRKPRKNILFSVYILVWVSFVNITNLPIPYKYNIEAFVIFVIFIVGSWIVVKNYFIKKVIPCNLVLIQYLLICLFLVSLSAVLAYFHYGQPLIYGILASRRMAYCLIGVIIFIMLRREIILLEDLEKIFIVSFVVMLACYFFINIFFPVSVMIETVSPKIVKGFAGYSETRGIYRYRFDISLIIFGILYSLIKERKKLAFIYLFLSLGYLVFFFRGRIVIALLIFLSFLYLLLKASLQTKVRFLTYSGIVIPAIILFNVVDQNSFSHFMSFFSDGINSIVGKSGPDASANSRIFQAEVAWRNIIQFNYIGVGKISNQWSLTPEILFGYFHPSDIGLLGIWFFYGIAGIVSYFYLLIKISSLFLSINKNNVFIFCCWLYAIYILLSSLMTGAVFITAFGQFSIMLAVLSFSLAKNNSQLSK